MLKLCSIIICSLFFSSALVGQSKMKKEELVKNVVRKAKSFDEIENISDIVKNYPNVLKYIPTIKPIAPKDNPRISSGFGTRFHPVDKVYSFHWGIDFVSEYASSIHVTANGKVIFVGVKGGYGKCVIVKHNYGFQTLYAHLTEYYVQVGKVVKKGDIIAFLGNTGKSTGAHLHYETIKNNTKINPIKSFDL